MAARASAAQAFAGRSKVVEDAAIVIQKFSRRWLVQRMMEKAKAQLKLQMAMHAMSAALYGRPDSSHAESASESPPSVLAHRAQTAPAGIHRARPAPQYGRRKLLIEIEQARRIARRSALRSAHADQRCRSSASCSSSVLTQLQDDVMHRRRRIQTAPEPAPSDRPYPHLPLQTPGRSHATATAGVERPAGSFNCRRTTRAGQPHRGFGHRHVARCASVRVVGSFPPIPPEQQARRQVHSPVDGQVATPDAPSWPKELQGLVQFGEEVYVQFQRGITPATASRGTSLNADGPSRAACSLDPESAVCVESMLDLWDTDRVSQTPGTPAGIAHVLTHTQQADCLEELGECFRLLLGRYRAHWRQPETVQVDERDWLARRAMGGLAERGGEELKPLRGRIVRSTADLSPLVAELDKAQSPSIGVWRAATAGGGCGARCEGPRAQEEEEAGLEACGGVDSYIGPYVIGGGSMRGSTGHQRRHSELQMQQSASGGSFRSDGHRSDEEPWPQDHMGGETAPPNDAGGDASSQEWLEPYAAGSAGDAASEDARAVATAATLESGVSLLLRAITGDAGLAGALHSPGQLREADARDAACAQPRCRGPDRWREYAGMRRPWNTVRSCACTNGRPAMACKFK